MMRVIGWIVVAAVVIGAALTAGESSMPPPQYKYVLGTSDLFTVRNVTVRGYKNGVEVVIDLYAKKRFWVWGVYYSVLPVDHNPARMGTVVGGGRRAMGHMWLDPGPHTLTIHFPGKVLVFNAYNESGVWYIKYKTWSLQKPDGWRLRIYRVENMTPVQEVVDGTLGYKDEATGWVYTVELDGMEWSGPQTIAEAISEQTNSSRGTFTGIVFVDVGVFKRKGAEVHIVRELYVNGTYSNGTVTANIEDGDAMAVIGPVELAVLPSNHLSLMYPTIAVVGAEHSFTPVTEQYADAVVAVIQYPFDP